jgi:ribonuclease HI
MKKAVIWTDGASSGNPGQAGIGGVVEYQGKTHEFSRSIGITTNNVAEYSALIEALKIAKKLGAREVEVRMDSELVVKQINGLYKVKHENMVPLFEKTMGLLKGFNKFSVAHVRREENKRADKLSKEAIKQGKLF